MSCRDCKLWDINAAKDAAGRIRKNWAVKCLWVSTETWPLSVHTYMNKRPEVSYMTAVEGYNCKCFQKREE